MDEKEKQQGNTEAPVKTELIERTWVDDMKQELEDYIEEQGIYIRQ